MKTLGFVLALLCSHPLAAKSTPVAPPIVNGAPGQIMVKGLPRVQGDTVGHNLWVSTEEKTGFNKVNPEPISTERYLVKDLIAGQRYWFSVTALVKDETGAVVESKPSEKWSLFAEKVRGDETPTPAPQPEKKVKKKKTIYKR